MPESKTKLYHTYPDDDPFECSTGDLSDRGFEITVDKRTHELVIPEEGETEESVTIIVRPKAAPIAGTQEGWQNPVEYRSQQPCECHVPEAERRFRQDAALGEQCVPCWARGCLERATSGGAGPSPA